MFGTNPKRPPEKGDGSILQVKEIFSTIQGEGIFSGVPAIFIRLGGCNLACKFCDTDFEDFHEQSIENIISEVKSKATGHKLVVVTGGEPFRQPIEKLCESLLNNEFDVQIETNGTLWRKIDPRVNIVCSPKKMGTEWVRLREDLLARLSAIKFLVEEDNPKYNSIPEVGQSDYNIPVYVQPIWREDTNKNKDNHLYAAKIAQDNGYNISVQIHKFIGLE